MGKKLPPEDQTLYERCDEVLHYIWDPIGVAGVPAARDEYRSYLPQVFKLLRSGAEEDQIVDYLVSVETDRMGLTTSRVGATKAAGVLLDWRDWSAKEAPKQADAADGLGPPLIGRALCGRPEACATIPWP